MRLLGMPLWPERISDEQYIERIRKGLRKMRRWRYIMAAVGLGILAGMIWVLLRTIDFLSDINKMTRLTGHGAPTVDQQTVYAVYFIAVMMGLMIGFMFSNFAFHIISVILEYRKDRLLVECWDALSDVEKTRLRQRSS